MRVSTTHVTACVGTAADKHGQTSHPIPSNSLLKQPAQSQPVPHRAASMSIVHNHS
jgi:hypothetical protein